ncbi:cupin domain-containing protein, partial [Nitratireductor sp. GCM10026969]|uniref:cupin domain-containing protein n=1 Tax=Nitratireductor sp. GCM10026969 TaxID=3252645 RepID=UPI0036201255
MDALLDMLGTMRLSGGIFLDAEFTAPWCITAKVGPEDCTPFTPEPRHIIAYHYVTEGQLVLKAGDRPAVPVDAGEIVVLPRNDDHLMGSALNLKPVNADHLIQPGPDGTLARIVYGGGGARTRILCGFLGSTLPQTALTAMLPSVLTLKAAEGPSGEWIESSFRFAARELAQDKARSRTLLAKLAELLFMEAVRRYFAAQPPGVNVWAAAVRDPMVGRALALLHGQLARRWTTEALARELACSRSAFAE